MVGEQILHYEVIELLGRGAMGSVYKALDTRLDTFRALKFLNLGLRDLESAREHLVREAKTQAQLIHPNIATLLTLEIVEDLAFLVIEYIDGYPLDVFLAEENPGLKDRLRLLLPIANALGAAHQQGIIHRDIKPSNILVGKDGSVKVTDFGLAKAIGHTELSKTGETKGSVLYMPPEAFRGERVREPADVWSLGVVSYEVLEGQPPFAGESFEAIGYRILRKEHPALSSKVQQALPGIDLFLGGCLDKDPEQRIQNGLEAFQQLRQVAESANVAYSPPVVRPARTRKRRMSRKKLAVRLGLSFLIALLATTVFFRNLFPEYPELVFNIPLLQSEDSPSWNPSGTRIAYLIGDHPSRTLAVREIRDGAGPEHFPIPEELQLSRVCWSRSDSILVLSGSNCVILYNLETQTWKQIADYNISDPQWSLDGHSLLWVNQQERTDGLEIVRNIEWIDSDDEINPEIIQVPIDGLPPPVQGLRVYNPVLTHGNTRIIFALYRTTNNFGIWSVPIGGGTATRVMSADELKLWDLQWDHVREELICKEHGGEDRLFRLKIGERSGLIRRVTQIHFPPDDVDRISHYDYHPETGQFVLTTAVQTYYLWSSPLQEEQGFVPLVTDFEQVLTLSVSPDQTKLHFVSVDLDAGMLIQVYDLTAGTYDPLHALTRDYGSEHYPQVYPDDDRYVIFKAEPRPGFGDLCYWDLSQERLRSFEGISDGGDIDTPCWSADGRYIYYRFVPNEVDAPRHFLRIEIDRTDILQQAGPPDTLYSGYDMYNPLPGPEDEYMVYQRGTREEAILWILNLQTGETCELAKGSFPALSPSRNDVYFKSGHGIHRIGRWWEGFQRVLESEFIVGFPAGVQGMDIGSCLAVSDEALFAVLTHEAPGHIKVFRMP